MLILTEQEYDIPPDVIIDVSLKEFTFLAPEKYLNGNMGGSVMVKYESAKKAYQVITVGEKVIFTWTSKGLEIAYGGSKDRIPSLISISGVKSVHYHERHFINGGKPLNNITAEIYLTDGGLFKISYSVIGIWIENDAVRKKILGIK